MFAGRQRHLLKPAGFLVCWLNLIKLGALGHYFGFRPFLEFSFGNLGKAKETESKNEKEKTCWIILVSHPACCWLPSMNLKFPARAPELPGLS